MDRVHLAALGRVRARPSRGRDPGRPRPFSLSGPPPAEQRRRSPRRRSRLSAPAPADELVVAAPPAIESGPPPPSSRSAQAPPTRRSRPGPPERGRLTDRRSRRRSSRSRRDRRRRCRCRRPRSPTIAPMYPGAQLTCWRGRRSPDFALSSWQRRRCRRGPRGPPARSGPGARWAPREALIRLSMLALVVQRQDVDRGRRRSRRWPEPSKQTSVTPGRAAAPAGRDRGPDCEQHEAPSALPHPKLISLDITRLTRDQSGRTLRERARPCRCSGARAMNAVRIARALERERPRRPRARGRPARAPRSSGSAIARRGALAVPPGSMLSPKTPLFSFMIARLFHQGIVANGIRTRLRATAGMLRPVPVLELRDPVHDQPAARDAAGGSPCGSCVGPVRVEGTSMPSPPVIRRTSVSKSRVR